MSDAPDAWGPFFFISLCKKAGAVVEFADAVDLGTIKWEPGDFPVEGVPNAADGRVVKQSPQEDGKISFEYWPQKLDTNVGRGLFHQYVGSSGTGNTQTSTAMTASIATIRDQFQVLLLFTRDASVTSSTAALADVSLRMVVKEARITSHKLSMNDNMFKGSVELTWPANNRAGTERNSYAQSGSSFIAIPAYT